MNDSRRDVFISHASEDKSFARPLAEELRRRGTSVWFDEYELRLGDSLRRRIGDGLKHSRVGLVILSPSFFQKPWPQYELDGLTARQIAGEPNVILPVWHDIELAEVRSYSASLADLVAAKSTDGVEAVADAIVRVLNSLAAGADPPAALPHAEPAPPPRAKPTAPPQRAKRAKPTAPPPRAKPTGRTLRARILEGFCERVQRNDFAAARRGYDPDEVDRHLRLIADKARSADTVEELARHWVERNDFAAARRGYDPDEVDRHLRLIGDALASIRRVHRTTDADELDVERAALEGLFARQAVSPVANAVRERALASFGAAVLRGDFAVARRGYDQTEVDEHLGLIAGRVHSYASALALELSEVKRNDFSAARRGYDPDEVDRHLRLIGDALPELRRLHGANDDRELTASATAVLAAFDTAPDAEIGDRPVRRP